MASLRTGFLIFITLPVFLTAEAKEKPRINYFAFGGVGFAGIISEGEKKFERLRSKENALEEFLAWYKSGTSAERAYCMLAIHELDCPRYHRLKTELLEKDEKFEHRSGCLFGETTLAELFSDIEKGTYRPYFVKPFTTPDSRK
ncbi:hypothetical protein N9B73_09260 [Verrucomicrobiales bacterium]|nr:hypothetical protein [Verrucomicrobiales bacterium]